MFRKVLILAIGAILSYCCEVEGAQISVSWDGGGDGHSWSDAKNWDPNIVPDGDFVVTIDSSSIGGESVEVGLRQSRTINRLNTYGRVRLEVSDWKDEPSCSTIIVTVLEPNGLTNYGELEVWQKKHRELQIEGDVTNTTGANLWLSETDIRGNLYNENNGLLEVEYESEISGNFKNAGSMSVWGPVVEFEVEGTVHNDGLINLFSSDFTAKIIINDINGVIEGFGGIGVEDEGNLLQNKGAIYASGGSLIVFAEDPNLLNAGVLASKPASSLHVQPGFLEGGRSVNNYGTIQIHAGDGVSFECNLINESTGAIELFGGNLAATTITQKAGGALAGFGSISGNLILESGASIEITGPTNIIGDVNVPTGATLQIGDGQTLITGHTMCNGTIRLIGGTAVFQGGCDCDNCSIINEAGTDRSHFDINSDGVEDFKDFASFAKSWLWQASWYNE